jgi:hypothetical protein
MTGRRATPRPRILSLATVPLAAGIGLLAVLCVPEARAQTPIPPSDRDVAESSGAETYPTFHASPYLPLGHWAYGALDRWIARGHLTELSPFTRPYRRIDVAAALLHLEDEPAQGGDGEWMDRLRGEFSGELERLEDPRRPVEELRGRVSMGGGIHSQTHPDPLRPALEGPFSQARFLERATVELEGHMGSVATGVRVARDGRFRHDPRFPRGRVVPSGGDAFLTALDLRVEEAYIEIQGRRTQVSFGRQYRNWGSSGTPGLLRSAEAYSFDELGYRFGSHRISLTGTFTSFRDFPGDTARYHAAHRLEIRPRDNLVIGISEASLHGGPGGRLDLRLISPVAIWELTREGERDKQSNLLGQLDLWWKPHPGVALFGSLVADSPPGVGACCEAGGTLGVELPTLVPDVLLRARVSAVESLMYRTSRSWEEYSYQGIGLGWDQADVVLATLEAHWFGRAGLLLNPRLDVQVRGEESAFQGRTRPSIAEMEDFPALLSGVRETTLRPSLAGAWHPQDSGRIRVEWDLGVNRVRNPGHETGARRTMAVGWLQLALTSPWVGYRSLEGG